MSTVNKYKRKIDATYWKIWTEEMIRYNENINNFINEISKWQEKDWEKVLELLLSTSIFIFTTLHNSCHKIPCFSSQGPKMRTVFSEVALTHIQPTWEFLHIKILKKNSSDFLLFVFPMAVFLPSEEWWNQVYSNNKQVDSHLTRTFRIGQTNISHPHFVQEHVTIHSITIYVSCWNKTLHIWEPFWCFEQ